VRGADRTDLTGSIRLLDIKRRLRRLDERQRHLPLT
jgi:hypothetical protein